MATATPSGSLGRGAMENPSSATRADAFPAGLRVLVVDDDLTWLKILEKMLRKCSYEVTTCGLATTALDMLRERKDRFDIVISDVNMPDMDGFKLLEQVGLEMDLPVIMMSVDGETSRVMKGVQHGACDYLLKPVRMKELKNIWQHVFRKKIHGLKEIESYDSNELNQIRNRLEEFDEWQIHNGGDITSVRKRKDVDKEHNEQDFNDTASVKKARVVWSVDLHQKFVNAVNQIGFDKVGPKKILDLMNVPGLTRENVASHLQKYRLYLSRLQKQNEGKTLSEIVKSGICSKDSPAKFAAQSSITTQTSNSSNSFELPAGRAHHQDLIPRICEEDLSNIPSFQVTDARMVINTESNKFQKLNYVSELRTVTSSENSVLSLDYDYIPKHHQSGVNGDTVMHRMKEDKESVTFVKAYSQLQQPSEDHCSGDHQLHAPTPVHRTPTTGNDCSPTHIKPACNFESNHARNVPSVCNIDFVSSQVEKKVISEPHFEAAFHLKGCRSIKAYSDDDKSSNCSWISPPHMLNLKTEAHLSPLHDLFPCSGQNYGCFGSIGINSLEASEYKSNQTTAADFQSSLYDELQYNCEYPFDLLDLPTVDYGLFT